MNKNPLDTIFPYPTEKGRIENYQINRELLEGNHWTAFSLQGDKNFSERYARLRYVACNFAGLVSKVIADILFGEEVQIKAGKNQAWLEELWFKNKMKQQNYESAMSNSAQGDAVYRIRVEKKEIIIEDVSPSMYFPHLNKSNVRKETDAEELAWVETIGNTKFLIREIYEIGKISILINELNDKGEIDAPVNVLVYNKLSGKSYVPFVNTKIKHKLLFHIPNFRYSGKFWGVSDYTDIKQLIFALNNRMTKIGNILDKHSDPILAVPEGVIDEDGKVKRSALGMFEVSSDGEKPEYIVWNANLDNAFKEIEKLVEFLFMFSETSPDVMGMGKSTTVAESGRALKMRMIRTLAKKNRKQLYYDQTLKEILFVAQELSLANGFTVNGVKCPGPAEVPVLKWSDGVIDDIPEMIDNNIKKLDAGMISKKSAIMSIEGINEKEAKRIIKEIDKEKSIVLDTIEKKDV